MNEYEDGKFFITNDLSGTYQGIGDMQQLFFEEEPDETGLIFDYDADDWNDIFGEEYDED